MNFIIDVLIILGCYGLCYQIIKRNTDLNKLLIPIPIKDRYTQGNHIIFRFIPLAQTKADVPYNILILILFLIFSLLTKALFHNTAAWETFWFGYFAVALVLISISFNAVVLLIIGSLYVIPLGLAHGLGVSPEWMGVIVGIVPGAFGGIYIGIHYWLTRERIENEIYYGKDLEGNVLSRFHLNIRKAKNVWLKWSVLLTFVAIMSYWMNWNSLVGETLSSGPSIYQYGGVFLWTIISLNIFLFSVPLMIEMVQQASWTSAGLLSDKVKDGDDDNLAIHVGKYGKYNGFSIVTGLILASMCLSIGAIIAGNIIEKFLLGQILLPDQNHYLMHVAMFLSGFIVSVHMGFIFAYAAFVFIPARFLEKEILAPSIVADKLLNSDEAVFSVLRRLLPDDHIRDLALCKHTNSELTSAVCQALNYLAAIDDLIEKINPNDINLGDESRRLISKAYYGQVKKRMNKHLLADLFPLAIDRVEKFLNTALIFREYIQLRKMGLSNPNLRFFVETKNLFYPCVRVKSQLPRHE